MISHGIADDLTPSLVEIRRRFVEQQHIGPRHKGDREFHTLLHTGRERGDEVVNPPPKPYLLHNLLDAVVVSCLAPGLADEVEVFPNGEPVVDIEIWCYEGAPQIGRASCRERV